MKKLSLLFALFFGLFASVNAQDAAPKGKFSGYAFGDYFYNVSSPLAGVPDLNGVQLRRIYFTYDYAISESFSSRFRLEADQVAKSSDGKIGTFVKDAYLQWKNIFSGSDLVFGIQPTPAFEVSEGIWGNRFLEKTIMDLRGIVSSRDLAISLKGKLIDDGSLKYWVMFGNSSGNKPETDKYKRYYGQIQFSPSENLTFTGYGDFKAAKSKADLADPKKTVSANDITIALFAGYTEKGAYSLGLEGFYGIAQNGFKETATKWADKNGMGLSAFGTFNLSEEYALVGRYDYYDVNTDSKVKGDLTNLILAGFNYKPDAKVTISPNLIYETYEKVSGAKELDPTITARITVYYIF